MASKNTAFNMNNPLTSIKGISDAREKLLNSLGIFCVGDFLRMYPRDYEDRTESSRIFDAVPGKKVVINARIVSISNKYIRKSLEIINLKISDGTGFADAVLFNRKYLLKTLKIGGSYSFFGEIENGYRGKTLKNPVISPFVNGNNEEFKGILPIYRLTEGLSQNVLRNIMRNLLNGIPEFEETLPKEFLRRFGLCGFDFAVRNIHFPASEEARETARKRLAFDELLIFQLTLKSLRSNIDSKKKTGISFPKEKITEKFIELLPFSLSDSQQKVWSEICADMEKPSVMNRLVLGDVGSGKTVIAELAMLKAISAGYQALFMAPTEILAAQHAKNIDKLFSKLGIKTVLLTGSMKVSEKKQALADIASGKANCIVGTHALIQKNVTYSDVGLVITDEQHRFGVHQRQSLAENGKNPDILIMSATPIPRTLALSLYGDMDVSYIDTMPKGRLPVQTFAVDNSKRERVYTWARKLAENGSQVYIVHPLIGSSEEDCCNFEASCDDFGNLLSAEENYAESSKTFFKGLRTALIHGKMSSADKDSVMKDFSAGNVAVLFSTTVIEVGVDVANASLIIIENAERFGLAQLHQLRGRVGRSSNQAYCVLFSENKSDLVKERLGIMCKSNSGFEIAEKDLMLRGPGDFFGTSQHGLPPLKIANLFEDMALLRSAKEGADSIVLSENPLIREEFKRVCDRFSNTY